MKVSVHLIILALTMLSTVASFAQENNNPAKFFGYSTKSADYIVEPADYAVHYKRKQVAQNNQTKDNEVLTDTLTLAIGQRWSVYYCTTYSTRFSIWGRQNVKKTRQASKPVSLKPVPLSSVLDKKNESKDYVEGNFGDPSVIYKDRNNRIVFSLLYSSYEILNEQKCPFEWTLTEIQDTVLNYPCKQAEVHFAGRDYVAWYTPDIPIPDGPWKFQGLPGLILKVEDREQLFQFEAIGLDVLENAFITMNDDCEKVPLAYFNKIANEARTIRRGTFLFDGELFITENRPYSYFEMEIDER